MHALIEDVLPFLVAFYVVDGLAVVRRHEWLLAAPWSRFWVARSGLHLVGLSPFAEVVTAVECPLRFGSVALYVETGASSPGEPVELASVPLDGLRIEVSDRTLKLGERAVTLPSAAAAGHLAAVVRDLAARPRSERAHRLRTLCGESTDLHALRALHATHRRFRRYLEGLGLGLWIVTFMLLPVGVSWKWERGPGLATVLLLGAAFHAGILALSWVALRRLGYERGKTATVLLPLLFFPPSAAHASFVVFRDLYVRFDPLAVAGLLLRPADFQARARLEVHRLRREAGRGGEAAQWTALREKAWWRAFLELGTSLSEVLRPPARRGDDAASWCPLCGGEYRAGFAVCAECRVPLEPMA
jgi:hypothetical protein